MRVRLMLLPIVVALVGFLTLGCESGSLSGPKIELVGQEADSISELFGDYAVNVTCRYLNTGSTANITAKAEVNASNGSWTKRQKISIASDQEREIVFEFPEVDFNLLGDNSFTYGCAWET